LVFELVMASGRDFREDQRRAVDHEGEVLEVFATKRRDRAAALAEWRQLAASDPHHLDIRRLVRVGLTPPLK